MKPELVEHTQDPGEHTRHRVVAPEGLALAPLPTLEVGSLTQIVEGHAHRSSPGVGPPALGRHVGRVTHVSLLDSFPASPSAQRVTSSTTPRNALRTAEGSPRRQTTPSSISDVSPWTCL